MGNVWEMHGTHVKNIPARKRGPATPIFSFDLTFSHNGGPWCRNHDKSAAEGPAAQAGPGVV